MLHRGPSMAAAGNFTIKLTGHAGHAAMPHLTADPVQGAAHLIVALNAIVARNVEPVQTAVISVTRMQGAEAFNQIPETASIGGTYRAHSTEVMKFLEQRMREVAEHTAAAFNLKAEAEFGNYLSPTSTMRPKSSSPPASRPSMGRKVRARYAADDGCRGFRLFPRARARLPMPGSATAPRPGCITRTSTIMTRCCRSPRRIWRRRLRQRSEVSKSKEGRLLFVNKKKQKNFVTLGPCGFSASGPESKKFLRRFFQKAAAYFLVFL